MSVPDLSDVLKREAERRKLEAAAERAAEQKKLANRFEDWDGKMTSAFKGIFPAPLRRAFLQRAIERNADEQATS